MVVGEVGRSHIIHGLESSVAHGRENGGLGKLSLYRIKRQNQEYYVGPYRTREE